MNHAMKTTSQARKKRLFIFVSPLRALQSQMIAPRHDLVPCALKGNGRGAYHMKIGIAGIGKMGAGIAARLASLGHEMMVWNRSADKARATGLKVAQTPDELAAASEVVISMLADATAVNSVYAQMLP